MNEQQQQQQKKNIEMNRGDRETIKIKILIIMIISYSQYGKKKPLYDRNLIMLYTMKIFYGMRVWHSKK